MQVVRLVDAGYVDKMIAFDELPKELFRGVRMKDLEGYPRYWKAWLKENNAIRKVKKWNADLQKFDEVWETFTYVLDYKFINEDKQKWQEITNYVRKAVDLKVRLLDKIDDMAVPVAKDAHSELSIEPENVPIIPVPLEVKMEPPEIIKPHETIEAPVMQEPKRRGRPPKVALGA